MIRLGIILLTLATAAIHFWVAMLFPTPNMLFILNGIGYIGLLGLLYLPIPFLRRLRPVTRIVLLLFTALTIALFFIITGGVGSTLAYIDKVVEVVLVVLLAVEALTSRRDSRTA